MTGSNFRGAKIGAKGVVRLPEQAMRLDATPWFVDEACALIEQIRPTSVFEWGAGRSTIYFAQRCPTVSVEHHPGWARTLAKFLQRHEIPHVIRLVRPVPAEPQRSATDPNAYGSSSPRYRHMQFERYVKAIDQEGLFHMVVVDGRSRASCLKHAREHVAPGGWLVLDNSERPTYHDGSELVNTWKKMVFTQPGNRDGWSTTLWQRPSSAAGIHESTRNEADQALWKNFTITVQARNGGQAGSAEKVFP